MIRGARIGILALQGAFGRHAAVVESLALLSASFIQVDGLGAIFPVYKHMSRYMKKHDKMRCKRIWGTDRRERRCLSPRRRAKPFYRAISTVLL